MNTSIPKSLHTITSLVNVARFLMQERAGLVPSAAVLRAAEILGYGNAADPYGLRDKAVAKLFAGK